MRTGRVRDPSWRGAGAGDRLPIENTRDARRRGDMECLKSFPADEREATPHILVISTDPQDDDSNPNWPRSYVHIF
jgi:hypothetical protein